MNKTTLKRFEELCIATAPEVRWSRTTHFAGIYLKNRLIAFAHNEEKGHSMIAQFNYHRHCKNVHAELKAIMRLGRRDDYHKLVLVSARVNCNDKIDLARPCCGCSHLIGSLGFKKTYFSNQNGEWESVGSDKIEELAREHKTYNQELPAFILDRKHKPRILQFA